MKNFRNIKPEQTQIYLIEGSSQLILSFVMLDWFYLYLFNQRRIRLITRPISDKDDPIS